MPTAKHAAILWHWTLFCMGMQHDGAQLKADFLSKSADKKLSLQPITFIHLRSVAGRRQQLEVPDPIPLSDTNNIYPILMTVIGCCVWRNLQHCRPSILCPNFLSSWVMWLMSQTTYWYSQAGFGMCIKKRPRMTRDRFPFHSLFVPHRTSNRRSWFNKWFIHAERFSPRSTFTRSWAPV